MFVFLQILVHVNAKCIGKISSLLIIGKRLIYLRIEVCQLECERQEHHQSEVWTYEGLGLSY